MSGTVASKGVRGGGVTVAGQLLKAAVQMLSVIVLSRLLGPDDFGLIAMVTVAIVLGELVLDFGLTAAALRSPRLTHGQASNLFWMNSLLGAVLALSLFVLAPAIASVYDEPRVIPIAQVVAVTLLFNGLQAQVQVQLARAQRFTAIVLTDLIGQVLAFAAAVVAALIGWGYWALVVQVLVNSAVIAGGWFIVARWHPSRPRSGVGSRRLMQSGAHYALAQLLTFGASNIDSFVIGARWDATSLGYYNRGVQLLTLPLSRLLTPLTNVAIPTLTKMSAESSGQSANRQFIKVQALVALPVAAVFAIVGGSADSLIPLVLGAQWSPTVPLFQLLALSGGLRALSHVTYWLFLLLAPSRSFLASSVVTKSLSMLLIVIGSFHSVEAVALLYTVGLLLNWPINLIWLKHSGGLKALPMFLSGTRILLTSLPAAIAAFLLQRLPIDNLAMLSITQVIGGMAIFALTLIANPAGRSDALLIRRTMTRMFRRT